MTTTFKFTATEGGLWISAKVATPELAKEIAALFPKAVKMRGTTITGCGPEYTGPNGERITLGYLTLHVKLAKDGVRGDVNETGIRRARRAVETIEKLGFDVDYVMAYGNSITRERLDEILASV